MAQSMPASVLAGQLNEVTAVEALSKTCNSLQTQVEQLQSSLAGVVQFMSNFQQPQSTPNRNRHSSNESSSISYFHPGLVNNGGPMAQSIGPIIQSVGPLSLPINASITPQTGGQFMGMKIQQPYADVTVGISGAPDSGMAMSR